MKKPWTVLVGEYLGLGITLPVATFVGYGIGYYLDKAFGTHFLYLVFLLFGIAAGLLQVIRKVLADTKNDGSES